MGLFAVLAAAATFASAGSASRAVLPTIYVHYTMSCTFSIVGDNGGPVTSIAPGTYQVEVTSPVAFGGVDLSGSTDYTACKGEVAFQLTGPGVSYSTNLQGGDATDDVGSVVFQPSSTYTAQDGNQPAVTRMTFSTTASGSPTSPSGSSSSSSSGSGSASSSGGVGSAIPKISTFKPVKGKPGASVTITGKNLTAATVKIGGKTATRTVNSATKIVVTVPAKAKTGKISVTTKAGGTTTSTKSFTVT